LDPSTIPPSLRFGVGAGLMWVAGLVWLFYFQWRAERGVRAPVLLRLAAVGGGYASAMLGLFLFHQLEQLGIRLDWERIGRDALPQALRTSLLIGAVEESSKLLPVLLMVRLGRGLERPRDGLLFAACAGIGFSGAEGTMLWMQGDLSWLDLLARAAASPFTHALFSIPWGVGLAATLFWGRSHRLLTGLFLSILWHGLYDLVLASPEIPHIAAALGVLVLWLFMLRRLAAEGPAVPIPVRPVYQAV
jgi:RsiW-degrading membrane proteinase PrsW (M82 family)